MDRSSPLQAQCPELPVLPGENHLLYLQYRTFQASFQSATSTCSSMRAGADQGRTVSPVLFSLYANDMSTPSRHVELALYAEDMALVAMSLSSSLIVN